MGQTEPEATATVATPDGAGQCYADKGVNYNNHPHNMRVVSSATVRSYHARAHAPTANRGAPCMRLAARRATVPLRRKRKPL